MADIPLAMISVLLLVLNAVLGIAALSWIRRWQPYDPSWLVALASAQIQDEPWLADALSKCTKAKGEHGSYIHFVSSWRANQLGSAWQFERNVLLESEVHGDLILDILIGKRVGGIEFLSKQ